MKSTDATDTEGGTLEQRPLDLDNNCQYPDGYFGNGVTLVIEEKINC